MYRSIIQSTQIIIKELCNKSNTNTPISQQSWQSHNYCTGVLRSFDAINYTLHNSSLDTGQLASSTLTHDWPIDWQWSALLLLNVIIMWENVVIITWTHRSVLDIDGVVQQPATYLKYTRLYQNSNGCDTLLYTDWRPTASTTDDIHSQSFTVIHCHSFTVIHSLSFIHSFTVIHSFVSE